jgi:hypothetical protein
VVHALLVAERHVGRDDVVFRRSVGPAHGRDEIRDLRANLPVLGGWNVVAVGKRINSRVVAGEHIDFVIAEELVQVEAVEGMHPRLIVRFGLLERFRPHGLDAQLARQRQAVLGNRMGDRLTLAR